MSEVVYTTGAHLVGGRHGTGKSIDNDALDLKFAFPKALGGDGNGANPEQLFALGYGACFLGAVGFVAKSEGVTIGEHSLDSKVDLLKDAPTFKLAVTLTLNAPSLDKATAQSLLEKAHAVCPYSKATRGNVDVTLAVG